ncbi:MAG: methyltransferase domain-containing protein [Dehalococcoidia bacterium]|nr:methyltransferase domain-containing protein [Dehalococcoidia bacterium]
MITNGQVFDEIAESWYRVRHWPLLRKELEERAQQWHGGKLLNVGCAHGPDFLPFAKGFELCGVDISDGMLQQALKYSSKFRFEVELLQADAVSLPFGDNTFDWVVSVAAYHHIRGREERIEAFRELNRVLKKGGEAFLTVWNYGQRRFWLRSRDLQVTWNLRGKTVYRYYHLFSYGELRNLLARAGFEIVALSPEKAYRFPVKNFSRNICALVRKVQEG